MKHAVTGKRYWLGSCGVLHNEVAQYFPQLAPLLKWHLCSTKGPLYYITNTVYLAKEGNLKDARRSAVWPDATLEQLQDVGALEARLPDLLAEFQRDMKFYETL